MEGGGGNVSKSDCPDPWHSPESRDFLNAFCFWFGGVAYCALGVFGLAANAIIVAVFSTKDTRR